MCFWSYGWFLSSRRRHTSCALVTGVQTCALPIDRLVCPYHQGVYELDGRLINARQMPPDFVAAGYHLKPARVEVICGLVYVSIADDSPSLDRFRAAVTPYIAPHQPDRTKVAYQCTIVEEANWKDRKSTRLNSSH